jgi:hypothetical protein
MRSLSLIVDVPDGAPLPGNPTTYDHVRKALDEALAELELDFELEELDRDRLARN